MAFSLAQAHLYRLLNGGQHVEILSQVNLGQDRYALTIAGLWLGKRQIRCYLVVRHCSEWLSI